MQAHTEKCLTEFLFDADPNCPCQTGEVIEMSDRDETAPIRKAMMTVINAQEAERKEMEEKYGQVWNTEELQRDFEVSSFLAPFVGVTRKSDGKKGTLLFQHNPRYYFNFVEE